MNREIITSIQNPKVKHWIKLNNKKYREKHKEFIIEGKNIISEAKKLDLIKVILTEDENNKEGILVTHSIIKRISNSKKPAKTIAISKFPNYDYKKQSKVLILNNLQDPGNIGTLIRTANAFGYDLVVIEGSDHLEQKIVRSTQGSIFKINIINEKTISFLKKFNGLKIASCSNHKLSNIYNKIQIKEPFSIILGNEGNGISKIILDMVDHIVKIPILIESLNVAQAGAILLNEYKNN